MISVNVRESDRLVSLLRDAEFGLEVFTRPRPLQVSADYRLAFRELGLSIGLHANCEDAENYRTAFGGLLQPAGVAGQAVRPWAISSIARLLRKLLA